MKRWIFILAYDTSGNEKVELAFWSIFLEARDSDTAYAEGARLAKAAVPNYVKRGLNDYVREIP